MQKFLTMVGLFLIASLPSVAQDTPRVEVFGGYSYLRLDAAGETANEHGWNASVSLNPSSWFGIVADFSGHYGSPTIAGGPTNINVHSYLFGPRFSYRGPENMTPFVHALFGGSHLKVTVPGTTFEFTDTAWSAAVGGGLDVKVHDNVGIRLFQVDWLRTNLSDDSQNNLRFSAGIVFHFGRR